MLEELKALADAGTQFSQETLLELASFVEDAKAEIKRIQEEDKKIQETVVDQSMFGVDINGQSRILEAQGTGTTEA